MLSKELNSSKKEIEKNVTCFIKESKKKNILRKKPINYSIIKTFYESPETFFTKYKKSLKFSSYFDICGNSIFMHYFNILYEEHKCNKKLFSNNSFITNKILSNINIYHQHFNQFFLEHKDKLLIQDLSLETPLHKIAKFHDKTFFAIICDKLNSLQLLKDNLLLIANIQGEACYHYLFEEIKNKYEFYVCSKTKDYDILKNFVVMIKNFFHDTIFKPLPIDTKVLLNNFILKNTYFIIKKPNFDDIYYNIDILVKNEKDINICEYIHLPFSSGINYFNILFSLCRLNEDYNKLLNLVNQVANIKEIIKKKDNDNLKDELVLKELCILDHISYTMIKMNSSKINGKLEINYCIQLIKNIFKKIISDKNDEQIINFLELGNNYFQSQTIRKIDNIMKECYSWSPPVKYLSQKGIFQNLILNPYLNIEKKTEILTILNEVSRGLLEKKINNDFFSIYYFYKYLKKPNIDIIKLYGEDKYITKLFDDFYIVTALYKFLFYICENYDNKSLDKYTYLLNSFLMKENYSFINYYKIGYNLSNNNINQILQIILLFSKQKYHENNSSNIEAHKNNKISFESKDFIKIKLEFILTDEQLCKYTILDMFKKNKKDVLALKIIFSFKYDFSELINTYQKEISELLFSINDNFNNEFNEYLLNSDILEKNTNIDLENKIIEKLSNLLYKKSINLYLSKPYKKINLKKLHLIIFEDENVFLLKMKSFTSKYLKYFINNWDKPINCKNIINDIKNDIPLYCRYLTYCISTCSQSIKIYEFFINEFIFLLCPELKKNLEIYERIYYTEINCLPDDDNNEETINKNKKTKDNDDDDEEIYYFNKSKKEKSYYFKEKYKIKEIKRKKYDQNEVNHYNYFYFLMMIINIKIKYGNYNTELLYLISKQYGYMQKALLYYYDSLHENIDKKERMKHFFLTKKSSEKSLEDKLKRFIYDNLPNLKEINHSFFMYVIKEMIKSKKKNN